MCFARCKKALASYRLYAGIGPRSFTLRTVPGRIDAHGDPWSDLRRGRRSLAAAAVRLRKLQGA